MLTRRMLLPLLAAAGTTACDSATTAAAPAAAGLAGTTGSTGATGATGSAGSSGTTGATAGSGLGSAVGGSDAGSSGVTATPGGSTVTAASLPGTVVVVFQRFAADWINMLVPAGDPDYATVRPNLRINNPLMLDGFFGLHPGLEPLKAIWDAGQLAFVAATGWVPLEARDRSHFFAQSIAEAGARNGVSGGWLARAMRKDVNHHQDIWAALAAEASVPASFQGWAGAIAVRNFADYSHGSVMGDAATQLIATLAGIAGTPGDTSRRLATSMSGIAASPPPVSAVSYPNTVLGNGLKVAAQAIRGGLAPRLISVTSSDDWDTHVTQASRHNTSLPQFSGAIRAFYDDLGELMQGVTLVTMTEFGRKARENLGGTDHGTASSMLVMGGQVNGGRIYGEWPGLSADALFEGEDLEPTTDFRSVLGELLARRLGVSEAEVEEVFPGGYASSSRWRNFHR